MLRPCFSSHKFSPKLLATILVLFVLLVIVELFFVYLYHSSVEKPSDIPSWKMMLFHLTDMDMSYIACTLKESNVIGSGSFGKVYKVILHNGRMVAVKKIRNISRLGGNFKRKIEQEENKFVEVEVDTLGVIQHTNIMKLLYCNSK
ncbi:hypothetical protein SUGI_0912720 [Cryptomeria japonica]|nr:hypothetical protein SUGI_0912720 [Cryptomeria japonica]